MFKDSFNIIPSLDLEMEQEQSYSILEKEETPSETQDIKRRGIEHYSFKCINWRAVASEKTCSDIKCVK